MDNEVDKITVPDEVDTNPYYFLNRFDKKEEEQVLQAKEINYDDSDEEMILSANGLLMAINNGPSYLAVAIGFGDDPGEDELAIEEIDVRVARNYDEFLSMDIYGDDAWKVYDKLKIWASLKEETLSDSSDDPLPHVYFSLFPYAGGGDYCFAASDPLFFAMSLKEKDSDEALFSLVFRGNSIGMFVAEEESPWEEIRKSIEEATQGEDGGFTISSDRSVKRKDGVTDEVGA